LSVALLGVEGPVRSSCRRSTRPTKRHEETDMEARQTLRGSGVPKGLVIALAACAAVAVAMGASVIAKDMSSSVGTTTFHAAPGTVLRQDNPPIGAPLLDRGADRGSAAPAAHTGRSTGSTSVQDDGNSSNSYSPGWDAKSVREGHGA